MNGFTLEFVSLGTERLIPWFAQDFPPKCIVGFKLRFGGWRTNEHEWSTTDQALFAYQCDLYTGLFAFPEIS